MASLNPEKWQEAKEIFYAALRRAPAAREQFLDETCKDDQDLRSEVQSLLAAHDEAQDFMERPAVGEVAELVVEAVGKKLKKGQTVGKYKIISELGAGGQGAVYKALDTKLGRTVALKLLPPELTVDEASRKRFQREAQLASALDHPNICVIHDLTEVEGNHFIVMQFVPGQSVRQLVDGHPLELKSALKIAIQVCDAMAAAHAQDIIHRDIKAHNIIITETGQAKILDFGLAKLTREKAGGREQTELTDLGSPYGTPTYAAPEQSRGEKVDHRADIFSAGVLLYEMLAGTWPFQGKTAIDVRHAVLYDQPKPVAERRGEAIPQELQEIVDRALAKDPRGRYEQIAEMRDDLIAVLRSLPEGEQSETARFLDNFKPIAPRRIRATRESIAVLPFANLSADPENEYFCDGLAEELLNALAKIEGLKVAARTSAFWFKHKNAQVSEIGNALNVKTVLEGSVRKSGNRVRITVQLIDAADGYHLWSERYDREMKDIFDVQDEITLSVVDALKLRLLGDEKAEVLKRYTDNAEAYQLYLKGRYFWFKFNPESLLRARECFEQVIQKDPNFTLAYSGLADALQASAVFTPPVEFHRKTQELVRQALTLDSSIAEVWASKAAGRLFYEWDWAGAESDCKRSIELNPRYVLAHDLYCLCLLAQGKFDEAIAEARTACELDPLSGYINASLGFTLYYSRRYNEATDQLLKAVELDPGNFWALMWLIDLFEQREMYAEALNHRQKLLTCTRNNELAVEIGQEFQESGYQAVLLKFLDDLKKQSKQRYVSPLDFAATYTRLGEQEKALDWLERAFEERTMYLCFLKVRPTWDSLYSNPRYVDLLRRLGLQMGDGQPSQAISETGEARTLSLAPTTTDAEELSPKTEEIVGKPVPRQNQGERRRWLLIALLSLLITVSALFAYRSFTPNLGKQIESIAVLPFQNESGNPDAEYLSDGMTETLISSLSQLSNLNVKARSSVFRYKRTNKDLRQIARDLKVQAILNGSVTARGNDVSLYAELVDVAADKVIWSQKYDRSMSNLVSLQSEIARDISNKLRTKLSGADEQRLTKNYTENAEAYQLYLKGQYEWKKHTQEDLQKAIEYYNQALEKDPNYALAYIGLSASYGVLGNNYLPPNEAFPKAKLYAAKALALDDSLSEAHSGMGALSLYYDRDWAAAETELQRAQALDPKNAEAHHLYGDYLETMGRFPEAQAERTRAKELDPLSPLYSMAVGTTLYYAHHYDEATAQLEKTINLEPRFALTYLYLGQAYEQKKMYAQAIATLQKGVTQAERHPQLVAALAHAYALSGERDKANKTLAELREMSKKRYVSPYLIAIAYAGLGDQDQTFARLDKAVEDRSYFLIWLRVEPLFDPFRADPRFQYLLRRIGLL